jgi:hypothetical protein
MKKATRDRQESPVFKHDCSHCKFIIHANKTDYYMHIHDDYPSGSVDVTMIRRHSDNSEDYGSRKLSALCGDWNG